MKVEILHRLTTDDGVVMYITKSEYERIDTINAYISYGTTEEDRELRAVLLNNFIKHLE